MATGNLTLVPDAVAREISLDKAIGLANGVHFVDRVSKREMFAQARVVMVGAWCLESTRLLLNSGLGGASGALGHYLHDQFYISQGVMASMPEARDGKSARGMVGGGGYIPRFRNLVKEKPDRPDFIRGYAMDFSTGGTPDAKYFPSYGAALGKDLASYRGSAISATIMGEALARYENHVTLNKDVRDAFEIAVLNFKVKYTDNEFKMALDAKNTLEEICHGAGFEVLHGSDKMFPPGYSIHEVGTCRMGADAKKSVLNSFNQMSDTKNVFVVGGSSFVTSGPQNPTMTILALSMRASEYVAEQMRVRAS